MQSTLYIPKKLHVGFQNRSDTFTGKLAYVIYEDDKKVLRKETSWNGWRDKAIDVKIIDNAPTPNFVLNKGVRRQGYFSSGGRSVIRIYDPRDFEFEISVDNLIGLLMHSDVSKRDIVEDCVYAWYGKDLVLLPVNSEEYKSSVIFTDKQAMKVSSKEYVKGYLYEQKKSEGLLMYMGFYEFFNKKNYYTNEHKSFGKKHIFYAMDSKEFVTPGSSTISRVKVAEVHENFPEFDAKLHQSYHLQEIKDIIVKTTGHDQEYYVRRYKKVGNDIYQLQYHKNYVGNSTEISPGNISFYKFHISKSKSEQQISLIQYHGSYNNDWDKNEIYQLMGVDWKESMVNHSNYGYYGGYRKTDGTKYAPDVFLKLLEQNGFGDTLIGVNVLDQEVTWKD